MTIKSSSFNATDDGTLEVLVQSPVPLPTGAATELTLEQVDTDIVAFKTANHADLSQVDTDLLSFKSANHTDLSQVDTDLNTFKNANHTDLSGIDTDLKSGAQKTQLVDIAGNIATLSSQTGLIKTKQSLDIHKVATASGYYSAPIEVRQSTTSSAGTTVWAMRNPTTSTVNVYIERMVVTVAFSGTKPIAGSILGYRFVRFSAATPTGGTTINVIKRDNADPASQVTDVRFLDTGLITTGIVFESNFETIATGSTDGMSSSLELTDVGLKLAPGEGFCLRLASAAIIGLLISGSITWSER